MLCIYRWHLFKTLLFMVKLGLKKISLLIKSANKNTIKY
ncbi:hypothetical protein KL86DYS2_11590 [uncultured Dysgonomonas sp.]|uniref:Uncharacterized protein n=1 Tax=uncultured Dysgonomonas sp. TaxID=206096 RepID=A0A212JI72_9BACT|nr:hypothetical protein KL86DYS2_11590 [uncultured Dysgonomonas sp.]